MFDVSVIIVNYNCSNEVEKCVSSLRMYCKNDIEIILVDNKSVDLDIKKLKTIAANFNCNIVQLNKNLGFAAGCNAGASRSKRRWLHFLNPDCEVTEDIKKVYENISSFSKEKIYTTCMSDNSGVVYNNIYAVPKFLNLLKISMGLKGIYWAQGSSIIIAFDSFSKIGGWDESYFMYAEDLDICYRAALDGIMLEKIDCLIRHLGGGSTSSVWNVYERLCRVYDSQLLFYKKHGSSIEYLIVSLIIITRAFIKNKEISFPELRAFVNSLRRLKFRNLI